MIKYIDVTNKNVDKFEELFVSITYMLASEIFIS